MLENKNIVLYGGAGLIGKEFVKAIKKNNGNVIVIDKISYDDWKKLDIFSDLYISADITSEKDVFNNINTIANSFENIDAVVNTTFPKTKDWGKHFFDIDYSDFVENITIQIGSSFIISRLYAKYFRDQGFGNIINIGSIQGVVAPKFDTYYGTDMTQPPMYSIVKSGVIHLTKYMAKYFKGNNIRVNCISPGGIFDNQPKQFLSAYKTLLTSSN